jgi:hypothetical protein
MTRREDTSSLESLFKKSYNVQNKNIVEMAIFIGITIIVVAIIPVTKAEIKNESLLLAVLIFGIYLVLSGRISQLKFMDFEVQVRDVENKTPKIIDASNVEIQPDEIRSGDDDVPKANIDLINEKIIPKLIKDAKTYTTQVLRLIGIGNKSDSRYKVDRYSDKVLFDYLKYVNHVVFVDYDGKLCGFSTSPEISTELSKGSELINKINKWELDSPIIRNNAYIEEGTSRKQTFNKMNELKLDTLPVVSKGERYVGVTEKDTIIYGIVKDLYAKYTHS